MTSHIDYSDILMEFLEVAVHTVLFTRRIYPDAIFTLKKKYNTPVHVSTHPELNSYISDTLKAVKHLIVLREVKRVDVCFFNKREKPIERFSFVFSKLPVDWSRVPISSCSDPYLTQLQEAFRAFCLKTAASTVYLNKLPKGTTFKIQVHTSESSSVSLAEDPQFQLFPWIETERDESHFEDSSILPVRNVEIEQFCIEIFAEENCARQG